MRSDLNRKIRLKSIPLKMIGTFRFIPNDYFMPFRIFQIAVVTGSIKAFYFLAIYIYKIAFIKHIKN